VEDDCKIISVEQTGDIISSLYRSRYLLPFMVSTRPQMVYMLRQLNAFQILTEYSHPKHCQEVNLCGLTSLRTIEARREHSENKFSYLLCISVSSCHYRSSSFHLPLSFSCLNLHHSFLSISYRLSINFVSSLFSLAFLYFCYLSYIFSHFSLHLDRIPLLSIPSSR
jgi:hypothetical protein